MDAARLHRRRQRAKEHSVAVHQASIKLQAFLWVVSSLVVAWFTRLPWILVGLEAATQTRREWLLVGLSFTIASLVCAGYMAWKLPPDRIQENVRIQREVDNQEFPRLVPGTIGIWFLGFGATCVGLWPVFGGITPVLLGFEWWGFIMIAHFLPGF